MWFVDRLLTNDKIGISNFEINRPNNSYVFIYVYNISDAVSCYFGPHSSNHESRLWLSESRKIYACVLYAYIDNAIFELLYTRLYKEKNERHQ